MRKQRYRWYLRSKSMQMVRKWTKCGRLSTTNPSNTGCGGPQTIAPVSLWPIVSGRESIGIWTNCAHCWLPFTSRLFMQTITMHIKHIFMKVMLSPESKIRSALNANTCLCVPGAAGWSAKASAFLNHTVCTKLSLAWLSIFVCFECLFRST